MRAGCGPAVHERLHGDRCAAGRLRLAPSGGELTRDRRRRLGAARQLRARGRALLRRGARPGAQPETGRGATRRAGARLRSRRRAGWLRRVRDRSHEWTSAVSRPSASGGRSAPARAHPQRKAAHTLRDTGLRRDTSGGRPLRRVGRSQGRVALGFVLGRIGPCDGGRVRRDCGGVRRCGAPRRARRSPPARLDRERLRMAERPVAPRSGLEAACLIAQLSGPARGVLQPCA